MEKNSFYYFSSPDSLQRWWCWQCLLEILSPKIFSFLKVADLFRALTCLIGDTQRIREQIIIVLEIQTTAEPPVPLVLACQLQRQP